MPGLLTLPPTFQEMVGRGCPDASQDRFSMVFSCTRTLLSRSAIHGGPGAEGSVGQQTRLASLSPHPEPARAAGGSLSRVRNTQLGADSRG